MMTSDSSRLGGIAAGAHTARAGRTTTPTTPDRLFVWAWLPGSPDPVVVGALDRSNRQLAGEEVITFTYATSYRNRNEAISLFPPELPLSPAHNTDRSAVREPGSDGPRVFNPARPEDATPSGGGALHWQASRPRDPLALHGCIRDGAPDAWGRRVINLRLLGNPDAEVSEMMYLAHSSSDRIGALDFQASATDYVPRQAAATLEQLLEAASLIEAGKQVPDELAAAAGHGTSIGGARPKALLRDGDGPHAPHLIAKFSSSTDTRPVVKAEAVAMVLAARAGLRVAPVQVQPVAGKDVLLVERFDRPRSAPGCRRLMLSALTVLGYGEMASRYASYAELARLVRGGPFADVAGTLREIFTRLVFSICVGNTDDHLRNHAFFWDGDLLELTPAYDLCPTPRTTDVATQAIGITDDGRRHSQLWMCRAVAAQFHLSRSEADAIINQVVDTITDQWGQASDEARLTRAERQTLWQREVLNPYISYDEP